MSKPGSRILKSARQALAYAKGTAKAHQYGVHVPERLNVKAIRRKVCMSPTRHFGVSKRVYGISSTSFSFRDSHENTTLPWLPAFDTLSDQLCRALKISVIYFRI